MSKDFDPLDGHQISQSSNSREASWPSPGRYVGLNSDISLWPINQAMLGYFVFVNMEAQQFITFFEEALSSCGFSATVETKQSFLLRALFLSALCFTEIYNPKNWCAIQYSTLYCVSLAYTTRSCYRWRMRCVYMKSFNCERSSNKNFIQEASNPV